MMPPPTRRCNFRASMQWQHEPSRVPRRLWKWHTNKQGVGDAGTGVPVMPQRRVLILLWWHGAPSFASPARLAACTASPSQNARPRPQRSRSRGSGSSAVGPGRASVRHPLAQRWDQRIRRRRRRPAGTHLSWLVEHMVSPCRLLLQTPLRHGARQQATAIRQLMLNG